MDIGPDIRYEDFRAAGFPWHPMMDVSSAGEEKRFLIISNLKVLLSPILAFNFGRQNIRPCMNPFKSIPPHWNLVPISIFEER